MWGCCGRWRRGKATVSCRTGLLRGGRPLRGVYGASRGAPDGRKLESYPGQWEGVASDGGWLSGEGPLEAYTDLAFGYEDGISLGVYL
jgi:hypothetical protein